MIRIHADSVVPKYPIGKWLWNEQKDELNYISFKTEELERELIVETSNGFKFKAAINQIEEVIFRQEFSCKESDADTDAIRIEDIKNLVLFLAPRKILTNQFITFVHTVPVDRFLNALIIYFEHFLRFIEFILIRRDLVAGKSCRRESTESTKLKRIYSEHLAQYRIVLAREYSVILMGDGIMGSYYHLNTLVKISKTYKDRTHHESFLAFATQLVWIAHHRRAYDVIESEMNRLFRSAHFKLTRKDPYEFTRTEQHLLYGQYYKVVNWQRQTSPLIQELANIRPRNLPILWIGEKKYRGNDLRMQHLELEYIVPESDLYFISVRHGILGDQKILYNTMLTIDWDSVRERGHTISYDPYKLAAQPYLEVPELQGIEEIPQEHFESYFYLKDHRFQYSERMINKWKRRDKIVNYIKHGGLVVDVIEKCKKEIERPNMGIISVAGITKAFVKRKVFTLKKN